MSQDHRQRRDFRKLFIGFQGKALLTRVCFRFYRSHALEQHLVQPLGPCFALGVVLLRIGPHKNQKFNPTEFPGNILTYRGQDSLPDIEGLPSQLWSPLLFLLTLPNWEVPPSWVSSPPPPQSQLLRPSHVNWWTYWVWSESGARNEKRRMYR